MRVAIAVAVLAGAGLALGQAGGAPDLRVVSAPVESIEAREGALLAVQEFSGPARLQLVRPGRLRPVVRPLPLHEDFIHDFAISPDGTRLAIGSEMHSTIQIVDLRRWRSVGAFDVPGPRPSGYGGTSGLTWPSERRLVVLSGAPYMGASPVVVDPVARRVVRRSDWRGAPLQWDAQDGRLVALAASRPNAAPGPATLMSYDLSGRVREVRLSRILAGSGERGTGPARDLTPALAVDWKGERAYVVSTDGVHVAEVDLRSWRLVYHELYEPRTAFQSLRDLIEPPAHAKGEPVHVRVRFAEVLPNGAIAVTGEDRQATRRHVARPIPFGLRLIDPSGWTVRTVDAQSQDFTLAGGLLLARRWSMGGDGLRGIGVRAYDTAGALRYSRFEGDDTIVRGAAGRYAYVEVKQAGGRRIHALELQSGRTVHTLPWSELRVLERER
jgi:Lipoprotein LpqB beta-propeller domain